MQVATVAREWGQDLGLSTVSLIGGANLKRQQEKLKSQEVVVGTPGRFQPQAKGASDSKPWTEVELVKGAVSIWNWKLNFFSAMDEFLAAN